MAALKLCCRCGCEKALEAFSVDRSKVSGRKSECLECTREKCRIRRRVVRRGEFSLEALGEAMRGWYA